MPLTIRRGDTHDVTLTVSGDGVTVLDGVSGELHVRPQDGTAADTIIFSTTDGSLALAGDTATWTLDGTLAAGIYVLELEVTIGGKIVTVPSDRNMRLVVLDDLA